jgi:TetR/AcrR family transcriptional regulator, regulator of biofilm formation and stress response
LTTRRDPEARRRTIVTAAVRAIADVGVGNVTHRQIAGLAGVPLGSTTYYFPTLDDLVAAAMREAIEYARAELEAWAEELTVSRDLPGTYVDVATRYLSDREQVLIEYELYLAAARSSELRPMAQLWIDGLRGICARFAGKDLGFALAAMIDGHVMQALAADEPLDADALRAGVERLVNG